MKVMFLTRSLHLGGAERQLSLLARCLHARGHEVVIATFYDGGPLERDLVNAGVAVRPLNKRGRWDVLGFASSLIATVRQEAPDVIHGYLSVPNLLTLLLKPLFPKVRIVWGVRASYLDRPDWLAHVVYRLECLTSGAADIIIVNSHAGKDYALSNGFAPERLRVIPNGIDTARFKPNEEGGKALRRLWNVGEQETLIGLVGRIDPMKDHPTFLKAAALFARSQPTARFVCVGHGPEALVTELKQLALDLGVSERIIWAGGHEDMAAVYSSLNLAVSASYGEGFPNVIGEAMACGVPCVVTNVGDSADIIGDLGFVVPARDPDSMAAQWKACLERYDASWPARLRARITNCFSVDRLVEETEMLLWPKA